VASRANTRKQNDIAKELDAAYAEWHAANDKIRGHLGASVIGHKCARHAWYAFRWAWLTQHKGRMLRLFDRGHDEEHRIRKWLEIAGHTVVDRHPETGAQFKFHDHGGHFSGSCDGYVSAEGRLPVPKDRGWGTLEDKTHSDKSFSTLLDKGVLQSKLLHYVQSQLYMKYFKTLWTLYFPVNKNDDDIEPQIIWHKPEVADYHSDIARRVIASPTPPPRISENSSWWVCKMCDYRDICHHDKEPKRTCRMCEYSSPVEDGQWHCGLYGQIIPSKEHQMKGCEKWQPIS
jgi:hypothetical protein